MGFLDKIKEKIKREKKHQEVYDLKTGKTIKIVKVKQPDGSFVIKRLEEEKMPEEIVTPEGTSSRDVEKIIATTSTKKREAKPERTRVDLVSILDQNIGKISTLKEERDTLLQEVLNLREQLKELETHKSAKQTAEKKIAELEKALVTLRDKNVDLEESIARLKSERDAAEEKLKKYESVLVKVRDKVMDIDKRLA